MTKIKHNPGGALLLTGATGFLGAHILPALLKAGYCVVVLKRKQSDTTRVADALKRAKVYDIDDERTLESIFKKHKFCGVIHLATDYGKRNNNHIKQMCQANIELATELLEQSVKRNVKFFVNTHTYANSQYTLYSAMKNAMVEILHFFASNSTTKIINMRLEYVYGPKDDTTKLIPLVIETLLKGGSIKSSPGKQKRDFIYIDDVVGAYLKVLAGWPRLPKGFNEFQVGTGRSIALKSFVQRIEQLMGRSGAVQWGALPYRLNEIFDSKADLRLIQEKLKWRARFEYQEGLEQTIAWHKEQNI